MPDPTQFDPDPIRVALDHGEVVELEVDETKDETTIAPHWRT